MPPDSESLNDLAEKAYGLLNPHPNKTFTDKAQLSAPLAAIAHGQELHQLPAGHGAAAQPALAPALVERLGLFRLVECAGSHALCFTDPRRLADAIERAGRD